MTISMCWLIAGVLMLVCGLVWLLGPFGLIAGAVVCIAIALVLAPTAVRERPVGDPK